ncbi:MAG: hypothetical protein HZB50_15520 [Chloroflexi bacterium]|nr:hypothetical protein [Chloroflexota bacterium]
MNCQTISQPATFCTFIVAEPKPIYADSRDYGFDFDEEENARELLAPLPASLSIQSFPEVDADEFEQAFHYFLS